MAGFSMRKNQRFNELVPVLYRGDKTAGEGMLKNLSLTGGSIKGSEPVSVGMALRLRVFIPGDPEPLVIDQAVVKWVKDMEFGVELTLQDQVAERITKLIAEKAKKQHSSRSRQS